MALSHWALWYHTLAGIRHLIWDNAYCLDIPTFRPNWAGHVVIGSVVLTLITLVDRRVIGGIQPCVI